MSGFEQPTRCVNCGGKPYAEDALGLPYCKNCVKGHDAYAQGRLVDTPARTGRAIASSGRDPQDRSRVVAAMIGKRKVTEGEGVAKGMVENLFTVYEKAKRQKIMAEAEYEKERELDRIQAKQKKMGGDVSRRKARSIQYEEEKEAATAEYWKQRQEAQDAKEEVEKGW